VIRLLIARLVLVGIGVLVWGYGNATSQPRFMYAGMGILIVALLLRLVPKRWFDDTPR
jgi:uncharacterized membrane protein YccC